MSLILEALKKSEQQRQLGQVPSFGSPALAVRRRRSLLPVLVMLILAALGVGWWFARTPVAPVAEPAATAKPQPEPAPQTAATGVPQPADKPAAAKPAAPKPAAATAAPPVSAPVAAPVLPMPTTDRPGSVTLPPSMPVAAGTGTPHAAPAAPEPETGPLLKPAAPAPAKPAPAATPKPAAAPPAASAKPVAPPPAAPAPAAAPTAAPAPAPAPRAAAPALPLVWELPYSTRKDLPELALTMHVYSDAPAERFVVVAGERHAVGDDLGNNVMLREITADGMVLEYKGQRFLYPREGR